MFFQYVPLPLLDNPPGRIIFVEWVCTDWRRSAEYGQCPGGRRTLPGPDTPELPSPAGPAGHLLQPTVRSGVGHVQQLRRLALSNGVFPVEIGCHLVLAAHLDIRSPSANSGASHRPYRSESMPPAPAGTAGCGYRAGRSAAPSPHIPPWETPP